MPEETTAHPVEALLRAVEADDQSAVLAIASEIHYADLAQAYQDLDEERHPVFLKSIGPELAADMLVELPESMIEEALDHFRPAELKVLFRELSDDDRVDMLQAVGDEARLRYLGLLGPEDEELTRSLLRYEYDTAGGRMTTRFGRLFASMTVKQAIEYLRRDQDNTETLSRIFVVDAKGHLIGRVRLRDLAFNTWDTPIRDIMAEVGSEQRVLATADQEEAANILLKYDLVVLPVIDEFDHLLGIITHDDAMEILQEESTEDFERFGGIAGDQDEATYLNTPTFSHFRRRAGWLVGLAFVSIVSGYVMMRFGSVLSQAFVLSLFLPMVVAAGGNSGGQATTMVIRAMSLNELIQGTGTRVAWKELRTGFLLGLLLGICMALFTAFILPAFSPGLPAGIGYPRLALSVAVALTAQVTSATFLGSLLPFGARAMKLDPAVVSAPAIAAIVDVSGMVIYFSVVRTLLGL
ncbi:magnesium transporter [Haloferula luteola]|uniref:Magnesium transporter MgtE n=1 Tax=Haloferula luteola TaxID=595692 RepID=A0A840VE81_9BACT|nr:magnesium transporter [Haloferula luteola]MBB5352180.1 magnesium transporter [Haloferula luteola]